MRPDGNSAFGGKIFAETVEARTDTDPCRVVEVFMVISREKKVETTEACKN